MDKVESKLEVFALQQAPVEIVQFGEMLEKALIARGVANSWLVHGDSLVWAFLE